MVMLIALLTSSAEAVIYWGNPELHFRVDRPADDYLDGTVTLDKVRVHNCSNGYTDYQVDDIIDPVQVNTVTITGGDLCGLTFYWDSVMDIDGNGTGGAFTVRYSQSTTAVVLDEEISPVALTPYSVVSGTMSSGAPWLLVSID